MFDPLKFCKCFQEAINIEFSYDCQRLVRRVEPLFRGGQQIPEGKNVTKSTSENIFVQNFEPFSSLNVFS